MDPVDELTRQRVLTTLAPLIGMFPNFRPADITLEAYVRVLRHVDPVMLEAAVATLLTNDLDFMPSAGKVLTQVTNLQLRAEGRLTAHEAWGQVVEQIRRVGHIGQPLVDELTLRAIKAVGGWHDLCMSENGVADRARFLEAYQAISQRDIDDRRMLPEVRAFVHQLTDTLRADRQLRKPPDG